MPKGPKDWSPSSGTGAEAIFLKLRAIAPSISFGVLWTKDPYFVWDGDGPDPAEEGFFAYDVQVSAKAIVDGELLEVWKSLGGSYSKPREHDPDIHGYLPQLLEEVASDLAKEANGQARRQALLAKEFLSEVMKKRYERRHGEASEAT